VKIAFLLHSLRLAGAERQACNLAIGLRRRGHDVSIATFYSGGMFSEELRRGDVRVIELKKGGRGDLLGFLVRLVRSLRTEAPDVLHPYLESPNILAACLKPLLPSTKIVWGVRCSEKKPGGYDVISRLISVAEPCFSRWADRIIPNSQACAAAAVISGFSNHNVSVIPNGIDTDCFAPDPDARLRLRAEWNISPGTLFIGRIGRFHPMKDYPTFLQAAAKFRSSHRDCRFLCLGAGDVQYIRAMRGLAHGLGIDDALTIAAPRKDMRAVYNSLDIVTSTSEYGEGFPNVIAEAMACGVACVATNTGDSAAVLGRPELVAPVKSPDAIAEAWRKLADGRYGWDPEQARKRVISAFGIDGLVRRTEEVLLETVTATV